MKYIYVLYLTIPFISFCNQNPNSDLVEKAKEIHERVITIDTHCDFELSNFTDSNNYSDDIKAQVTLPKMEKGGLDVAWFVVYTAQDSIANTKYENAYKNALAKFDAIHRLTSDFAPDRIQLALTSDDVRKIHKTGKKVAMIGVENGYPIAMDISRVKEFYDLGARYMSLAHNGHNQLSDSNTGERNGIWLHNGLSDLGKEVIREMNKYGMMIDVSHPSKEAMREMLKLTNAPIIASHSSARALSDHSRNLDNEQLDWLKENGGVVQIVAFPSYIDKKKAEAFWSKEDEEYEKQAKEMNFTILSSKQLKALSLSERKAYDSAYQNVRSKSKHRIDSLYQTADPVNVADFVDHIDYVVNRIGIEHVGISSDFDGGGGIFGWNDASESFNVTLELVKRGYTEDEIALLWGENLLRVLDEVQTVASKKQL